MIYDHTLRSLSEDELALIFLIGENTFSSLGMEVNYNFLKFLRRDVVLFELEKIKRQIADAHKDMVTHLQKKIAENI